MGRYSNDLISLKLKLGNNISGKLKAIFYETRQVGAQDRSSLNCVTLLLNLLSTFSFELAMSPRQKWKPEQAKIT